jgi:hypothetical protein
MWVRDTFANQSVRYRDRRHDIARAHLIDVRSDRKEGP